MLTDTKLIVTLIIISIIAFILLNYFAVNNYVNKDGLMQWQGLYMFVYSIPLLSIIFVLFVLLYPNLFYQHKF
jgi:DMSO/TMAO reductase YedYZ heme-binding membrane subunit